MTKLHPLMVAINSVTDPKERKEARKRASMVSSSFKQLEVLNSQRRIPERNTDDIIGSLKKYFGMLVSGELSQAEEGAVALWNVLSSEVDQSNFRPQDAQKLSQALWTTRKLLKEAGVRTRVVRKLKESALALELHFLMRK